MPRKYEKVQELLPVVKQLAENGWTQRQIAEELGLSGKEVVKGVLKRERQKENKIAQGIMPRPKGRPRKEAAPRDIVAEQAYEIHRLKMENVRNQLQEDVAADQIRLKEFTDPFTGEPVSKGK